MRGSEVRFYADTQDLDDWCNSLKELASLTYTATLSKVNASLGACRRSGENPVRLRGSTRDFARPSALSSVFPNR